MNIRYFFVADVIKRNHIKLVYCPTDEMIGDFFTKPLGGAKFRRFRNIIMNLDHDEYGTVNVDELMEIHQQKIAKRMSISTDKGINTYDERDDPAGTSARSQECVGDRSEIARPNLRGQANKPTYLQALTNADPRSPRTTRQPATHVESEEV